MKKRWISACLAALLLCGTAGCTAQQAPGQTTPEQGEPNEPAQTEQTAPVEEMAQKTQQQAYAEVIQGLVNEFGVIDQKSAREIYDENAEYRGLISILQYDLTGDGQDELIVLYASPDVGASQSETLGQDIHIEIYTFDGEKAVQLYAKYNFIASMGVSNVSVCSVSGQNVLFSASTRHFTDHILYYKDGELLDAVDSDAPFSEQEQQIYDEGIQHGLSGEGAALNEIHLQRVGLDYDTLQYIYGFSSDSGTFGLSEYEALQQALQDFGIKIPKKVVSAQTLLEEIAYLGDRSKCKMDAQMATAYANILDTLPNEVANMQDLIYHQAGTADIKAVLCDFAGDGYPVLAVLHTSAGATGGNLCQLWGYENGKAVNANILYPTRAVMGSMMLGKIGGETVLEIGEYLNYSGGSAAWEWCYYQIKNGQISTLHDLYYQEENSAFYADPENPSALAQDRKDAWNEGYRPLLQSYPCYPEDAFTHDPARCDGNMIANCGVMFKITDFDQLVTDEFLPLSEHPGSDMSIFDDSYTGFVAGNGVSFDAADDRSTLKSVLLSYAQSYGKPSYSFPEVSHMFTNEQLQAIAELFAEQLNGEIGEIYQMSDDLYYIVIYVDGKVAGCATVKQTMQGFRLVSTETEAASEDALHALVQQDQQTSNITLDYNAAGEDKAAYLTEALQNMDGTVVNDAAKGEIAAYIENAVTESSVTDVKCRRNAATIDADTIAQSLSQAQTQKDALDQTLDGVTLNKTVTIVLRIVCTGLDEGDPVQVTFDPSMLEALGDAQSVQVMLGDAQHSITVDAEALAKLCETHGKLIVQVQQQDGKYIISLLDGEQNPLDRISESLTFTLPAESETATVLAS
ncbi:hypothetical protein, partial [uncultured Agathobaculum sp.]|uniref:hypothetical protein n=1 Tax=uncultured Agathobaculum sp. TaxID=2048140 RepID=UPI00320A6D25